MACLDDNELLALLDGKLDPSAIARVEVHLEACAQCSEAFSAAALAMTIAPAPPVSRGLGPRELEEGARVGRYIVLGVKGAGAMGTVYSAYDPKLQRKLALKLLRTRDAEGGAEERQRRLLREAQAMARLSHPNVISVFDTGTFGEEVFVAMELIEGSTLSEWQRGGRQWREVLRAYFQAGRGLGAAHRVGLVHRDFKPDNVLVSGDGRVCLTDFGLARSIGTSWEPPPPAAGRDSPPEAVQAALTQTGMMVGTPAYMAPEQSRGAEVDARTDQFAFCVALYEALYGERPFRAESRAELAAEIAAGRVRAAPKGSQVPAWLRRVLLRGLSVQPDRRFPSMDALLTALEKDPSSARRLYLAGLGCVLLLGGSWVARWQERERQLRVCTLPGEALAAAWGEPRRMQLQAAFEATGAAYAARAWSGTRETLDRYVGSGRAALQQACEATWVTGAQSREELALRTSCLEERFAAFRALTDVLARADRPVVQRAVEASLQLPRVEACADLPALARSQLGGTSADPERARRVTERIARARVLESAGKFAQGLEPATEAVAEARALASPAILARALYQVGRLQTQQGDGRAAEPVLEEAALLAHASQLDELHAEISVSLVYSASELEQKYELARWFDRLGQASLRRAGGNPYLEARLLANGAALEFREGRLAEAQARAERALALDEQHLGAAHPHVSTDLNLLGRIKRRQGRYSEALAFYERALALELARLGKEHPIVHRLLGNRAMALVYVGRCEEGLEELHEVLALKLASLGPDSPGLRETVLGIGEAHGCLGQLKEQLAAHRRALAISRAGYGPDSPKVADALAAVGGALIRQARWSAAAGELEAAVGLLERRGCRECAELVDPLALLSRARSGLGEPASARETATRGLAIAARVGWQEPGPLAELRLALAQARWALGEDPEKARDLAGQARALLPANRYFQSLGDEIDRWLAAHPAGATVSSSSSAESLRRRAAP